MYKYKLTTGWLRSIYALFDLKDAKVRELHTIKALENRVRGELELSGNTLFTIKKASECCLVIRPGDTARGQLYIPHGGHTEVRTQLWDSNNVLEWSSIPFKRVPIVRGYIVKVEPDRITCSVQKRDGTYKLREFTSRRALDRTTIEYVIPYWMWQWSAQKGMRDYARKALADGFKLDDKGVPIFEYSLDDPKEDAWAKSNLTDRLRMPTTLPFRCAASEELVYQGVKLWDNQEYREWLGSHPEVVQKPPYGYDENSDGKILVYMYKFQDIPEERILKSLQFNDVYWTENSEDDESEDDETEEQETGETDE